MLHHYWIPYVLQPPPLRKGPHKIRLTPTKSSSSCRIKDLFESCLLETRETRSRPLEEDATLFLLIPRCAIGSGVDAWYHEHCPTLQKSPMPAQPGDGKGIEQSRLDGSCESDEARTSLEVL